MKDSFECGQIIPHAVREKIDLPVARHAGLHNPRHDPSDSGGSIPKYLRLDYRTHPQAIKDFFRNLLAQLKRMSGMG